MLVIQKSRYVNNICLDWLFVFEIFFLAVLRFASLMPLRNRSGIIMLWNYAMQRSQLTSDFEESEVAGPLMIVWSESWKKNEFRFFSSTKWMWTRINGNCVKFGQFFAIFDQRLKLFLLRSIKKSTYLGQFFMTRRSRVDWDFVRLFERQYFSRWFCPKILLLRQTSFEFRYFLLQLHNTTKKW